MKQEFISEMINSKPENTPSENKTDREIIRKIVWTNVIVFSLLHISAIYGLYLAANKAKWQTIMFATILYVLGKLGMAAGAHRLWSHRSYKATLPLRLLLIVFFTISFEGRMWTWARDHRVHHKYQETNADPHNAAAGLWFSHVGWLLRTKHPLVIEKGKTIDTSDLSADNLVMFQKRYYWPLIFLLSFLMPTWLPVIWWGERWSVALHVAVGLKTVLSLHGTWLINSFAHAYGNRPYDKKMMATENTTCSYMTLGEGWHNYHHAFPWDYRAAEIGFSSINVSKSFIDLCAKIGWAYDLRTASPQVVEARALRTGDGSRPSSKAIEVEVWGWGDLELDEKQRRAAIVTHRKQSSVDLTGC